MLVYHKRRNLVICNTGKSWKTNEVSQCGGLNENGPFKLTPLNVWFRDGRTVGKDQECVRPNLTRCATG